MNLPLDSIRIGDRFRHDIGDISELAASIDDHGLLHPIVVTSDDMLIAGRRRLEACRALGWTEIPVTVIDPFDIRKVEAEENQQRVDFTPSEAVEVTRYFEDAERESARERQGTRTDKLRGNLPPSTPVKSRDALAARVGMSGRTLEKAAAVVEAAEQDPEKYGPVKDEMDRTGKVDPAYRKVVDGNEPEPVQKKVKYPFLEIAKRAYLELNDKESKMFRKWLKNS